MKAKELIKSAGLNYQYFVDEAESIVRELKSDSVSESYVKEKIRHIEQMFKDVKKEKARLILIGKDRKKDFSDIKEEDHTNEEWVEMLKAMDKRFVKIPEWVSNHFLGAVPPIFCKNGFLCGEPLTHNKEGKPVFRYFFEYKGNNYGTISSKETADFAFKLAKESLKDEVKKSDYYCNTCGTCDVDEKLNCLTCGQWLGEED